MATRCMARVRTLLDVNLPMRALFEAPTVAAFAQLIHQASGTAQTVAPPIVRAERSGNLPLSFSQQRLWFIDQLQRGTAAYNVPLSLRLQGALDRKALEGSLQEIVQRHEILRTTFPVRNGETVQAISREIPFVLEMTDLCDVPVEDREAQAVKLAYGEAETPFDLEHGPLFRTRLLRLDDQDHILLVTMHHIVSDAWSMAIVVHEFRQLYQARHSGKRAILPELPIQYADFAVWQRQWLQGKVLDEQLGYWRKQLADLTTAELPADHPRPAVMSHRGSGIPIQLSHELTGDLKSLARQEGATLFMCLLAGLHVLLSKYTGQTDLAIGTSIANRNRVETEALIGFMVNTLVLRTDLQGNPGFDQTIKRVRQTALEAYQHQDVPFEKLVEELSPRRDMARSALFQVMLVLQNIEREELELAGLRLSPFAVPFEAAKFDLSISLGERNGELAGTLFYALDLFEADTVKRMADHLRIVLQAMAANPALPIDQLSLLTSEERNQVLSEWNRTAAIYPASCVHELFEKHALRIPDAVAVVDEKEQWTYAELNHRANQLANHLRMLGVGPEVLVGLCLDRSIGMIMGMLAILKAGGAYVPIDPKLPLDRTAFLLEDSQVAVLLTEKAIAGKLPPIWLQMVCIDSDWQEISSQPGNNLSHEATPENLAYLIYTSGSTGKPKAVGMEHRQIVNYEQSIWQRAAFQEGNRFAFVSSLAADLGNTMVFPALCGGGTLHVIAEKTALNQRALGAYVRDCGIDHLKITPSHLQAVLQGETNSDLLPRGWLILGGEASLWDWIAGLVDRNPHLQVMNHYGPTECTVGATTYEWGEYGRKPSSGTLPLGRPLNNSRVFVLDSRMDPVSVGVAGELYIGGAGVARGYMQRPDLTAERFVPDAFGAQQGGRLYRTGDKVKWLSSGHLEFLGRIDDQVKVRGFRVEPGEIEAALLEHPGVKQATVIAREDEPGDKRLVAYVVMRAESATGGLRDALKKQLPDYMVPAAFVRLEALPLLPNGKIDRRSLPAPETEVATGYVGPRDGEEEILCRIVREVLKCERVGIQDDFFELGGHSLLATQVVARIRSVFGMELPLVALFECPTVAALAERISQERKKGTDLEVPPLRPVSRNQKLPLSFAQQRLWFLDKLEPGSSAYNMPFGVHLAGPLDKKALQRGIDEIVRRHEVLRTRFPLAEGDPIQEITPDLHVAIQEIDLSGRTEELQKEETRQHVREEAAAPFDLANGPLLRARLLCLGEDEYVVLLTMHHIVGDGWSSRLMIWELTQLYAAYSKGEESPLPELPIQYVDFSVWQRQWLQGQALEEQLEYWTSQLSGAPMLELPTDRPRSVTPSRRANRRMLAMSTELRPALDALSRNEGTTLYMVLLAAFQVLLSRYSGQTDIVVGTPIAGRRYSETESLIGMFFNMLALRIDLSGNLSFHELLGRVREMTLGAYAHQDLPFEKLVAELELERDLRYNPLFQVIFEMNNTPQEEAVALPGLRMEPLRSDHEVAKVDMTLSMLETSAGLIGSIQYSAELFDASTIEQLIGHYQVLLKAIIADPGQRLADLSLLTPAEREQVVVEWNSTAVQYEGKPCMHELFEAQAAKTPDNVALVYKDKQLTYGQLDSQANQLARCLRKLGVEPETRVGICVERSLAMIVGLFGILKAGGAYVPLDPTYPADRVGYMLEDSGATVLLTQEPLLDHLPATKAKVIRLDSDWSERIAIEPSDALPGIASEDNLAYIYYTSGSTGRPKGVAMAHSGIANYLRWGIDGYSAAGGQGAPVHSSIAVDLTLTNFLPLFTGKKMVLVPEGPGVDGLVQLVRKRPDWSLLKITPTHLTLLNSQLSPSEMNNCTRVLVIGADNLVAEPTLVWRDKAPDAVLLNEYGPTETVVGCSIYKIKEDSPRTGGMPIGKPIANLTMFVLDSQGQPVPIRVPGELYIGGIGVARGYWGRPDLTAEKFLPDPFATAPGARFYRTGDRARFLPDGNIEFLGRVDHQVKIRGYRIEPAEVEAVLSGCPGVRKAMVVVREDVPGEKQLVAYVAARPESLKVIDLRRYLKERLPEYMVPSAFVVMESLPVRSSGKIDPKDLPAPDRTAGQQHYVGPRTEIEKMLSTIWAEVLNIPHVGVHDSFFEMGGHSLPATRVMSRIRTVFEVELPLRALFEAPTVAGLAQRIEQERNDGLGMEAPVMKRVDRDQRLPLSFAQQRLWFMDQFEPGSPAYNIPLALRLTGDLNRPALHRSINEIVRRHEVLRTVFPAQDAVPVQRILPHLEIRLHDVDLREVKEDERELELSRFAQSHAEEPFDLANGPLLRLKLIRLEGQEHVLLVNMHHVVSDAWSVGILVREFTQLYEAYVRGEDSPLPELAIQYADFAVWQQTWLQGKVLEKQLEYWKRQLQDLTVLQLPTDRPRPAVESHRGGTARFHLDQETVGRLNALGQGEGATLFMSLLAAFQVVLGRYTNQKDIAVGTDIANRNRMETEQLIGFFVNQLVLRTDLGQGLSFRELLARVRQTTLQAYEHQDLPFEKLVDELRTERDLGRAPLFQVRLVVQNMPEESLRLPGLEVRFFAPSTPAAKLDLELAVFEDSRGELQGMLSYAADLFDPSAMERFAGHLRRTIRSAVSDPEQRIDEISLLSAEEQAQIVEDWNWNGAECPSCCMHELFEERAAQSPSAIAVGCSGRQLSYGELNARANQLARYLHSIGVGPEGFVGVYLERDLEMMVAVLGILKAGGVYVPLDPNYPAERLAYMMKDANPQAVITLESLAERLPGAPQRIVLLDRDAQSMARESADNLETMAQPASLAYVMFTSGSTGRPKGVMVEHRGMVNHLSAKVADLALTSEDVVAQNAPSSFDVSIWQLLSAMLVGGRTEIIENEVAADPWKLLEAVEKKGVTVVETVPSVLSLMLAEQTRAGAGRLGLSKLRWMVSNAEALPCSLCAEWLNTHPHVALLNAYGPTECSDDVRHYCVRGPLPETLAYAPLGEPIMNARMYALDPQLQPVPIGVQGELYIGGICLGRGYLNQPGLTAERFVPNPFGKSAGERLYRTGDLGAWRGDGTLEFHGRADGQVKVRGNRVELGEIESALNEHATVGQAIVVAREDETGSKMLAAYVISAVDREFDLPALREHVQRRLPDYMVPGVFVPLKEFPLTPSGKLDRKALPAPEQMWSDVRSVGPRNGEEEILSGIFAEILGRERVGVLEDFFEAGGHSLLATQVVSRVRKVFGADLQLRAVFEAPTAAALVERIRDARRNGSRPVPPLVRAGREGHLPLSYAQQRLWFIDQLEPGSSAYNIPIAVRFKGKLDKNALQRSLSEIIRRHEVLRTAFPMVNGQPIQKIAAEMQLLVEEETLTSLDAKEREEAARLKVRAEASRPFDLDRGPLFRAKLFQLQEQEYILLITMHHIVGDGWSSGIMIWEFSHLYDAYVSEKKSALPELEIQYADFAVWERQWLQGETLQEGLGYWKKKLEGATVLELPTDRSRPATSSYRGARKMVNLPSHLKPALEAVGRREGATLYMTLLSAFQILLGRYAQQDDVVIGTSIAGRTRAETEPLLGMFFNVLALRTDLAGDPTFAQVLAEVRETTLGAYAHQELPFERLVTELGIERSASLNPLFQVIFEMNNTPRDGVKLPELEVESFETGNEAVKVDLTLSMMPAGLSGVLQYDPDLFDESTIDRLILHYQTLLEAIAENPDRRLSELQIWTHAERNLVTEEWNRTAIPYPALCMHQLFEHQAKKTPESTAVIYEDQRLTYREVDERANQLAHYLKKLGVGPEVRVGICVERSPELIIGLFGILKAGGAYVPLDPSYPGERLSYMLGDSNASVLLTEDRLMGKLSTEATIVSLDIEKENINREPAAAPEILITPENLAYIYYTSGSTGRPKGVAMAHAGIANYIQWGIEGYSAASGNGAPVHSSIAVDLTLTNFLPLFAGHSMTLVPEAKGVDGLIELMQQEPGWSLLKITPTHLALLNPQLTARQMANSTRVLVIGADNLVAEPTLAWRNHAPGVVLMNEYGPTETVVGCSIYVIQKDSPMTGAMPIGRPIANLTMYVLDSYGHPVPVGVPGELYIGGVGVARGYWNRPDLTAERFVPDPYAASPGARFYRTGDRARFLPDGNLEFLGRLDHQVKIRGYRIELGEVEAVLSGCPGVQKAMVVVREDLPGERRLVAYVAAPPASLQIGDLRQYLKDRLPAYMVPTAFVIMDVLPVRASGKIDPKDLPRPEILEDKEKYVEPLTKVEKILSRIWSEVLGVGRVGVNDNFFELGGDSILSIQVITRARQAGLHFTPRQLFEQQTIAELARVAGTIQEKAETEQGVLSGEVPLAPIQTAFFQWGLTKLEHYNQAILLELDPSITTDAARQIVQRILEQHEVLRMNFERTGQTWKQFYQATAPDEIFENRDLSHLTEGEQKAELEKDAARVQSGLDLHAGRLMKVVKYEMGAQQRNRILMVIHHLAIDGVSWRILLEDMERSYQQLQQGEQIDLGAKTTSYRQWTERLRQYAQEEQVRQELEYWTSEHRKNIKPLPRDFEHAGAENLVETQGAVVVNLEEEETRVLLYDLPGVYHTQINDVLLTGFARACAEWISSDKVLVDLEGHGREEIFANVDVSRTVGWFTNVYPVLLEAGAEQPWRPGSALARIKEHLRTVPNNGLGYGTLRYTIENEEIRKRLGAMPQAGISFNYLGRVDHAIRESAIFAPARESSGNVIAKENLRQYALEITAIVIGGKLQVSFGFSHKMHRRETIETLAYRYVACLRELILHCCSEEAGGYTPSDFPVADITQKELMQIASLLNE